MAEWATFKEKNGENGETFSKRLSAKPFLWKWGLFAWQLKSILISMD